MNEKLLNILLIVLIVVLCAQNCCCKKAQRYDVIPAGNMLTILVDHQTGMTWRNSICNEKTEVPGCWAKMYTVDAPEFNLPVGEKISRQKEMKLVKKMQKLQQKQQQTGVTEIQGDLEVGDDGAQIVPQTTPMKK